MDRLDRHGHEIGTVQQLFRRDARGSVTRISTPSPAFVPVALSKRAHVNA